MQGEDGELAARLTVALEARIERFAGSGDASAVLDPAAQDEAARLIEALGRAGGDVRAAPVAVLRTLAYFHFARFQALPDDQDEDDLQEALGLFSVLASRAPEQVPARILALLSTARRGPAGGSATRAGAAGAGAARGHPDQHTSAGVRAFREYQRTGRSETLAAAITAFRNAVAASQPGDPALPSRLSNLGGGLLARFRRAGDAADLDDAITAGRRAADLAPPGHTELPAILSNLGSSLLTRFERTGADPDLDDAITAGRRGAHLAPPRHPHLPAILSNLGSSLSTRFDRTGNAADLDDAIIARRRAVGLIPPADPDLPMILSNLGNSLHTRFEETGADPDLDDAIAAGRRAADLAPPGHIELPAILSNLGSFLSTRFDRTGNAADLDSAINAKHRAIALTPPADPGLPRSLSNLGSSLVARFERTGDPADLDEAITAARRATGLAPPGHTELPGYLSNLGASLRIRFARTGDAADLDDAIAAGRRATDLTPPGDPHLPGYLSNLANSLRTRFGRTGDPADLDEAITAARRATGLAPPGHTELPGYLSNLGGSLATRFEQTGDTADLDEAITAGRRAVSLTPPDHPTLPRHLANLSSSLRAQFERAEGPADLNEADLDEAITAERRAADLTPPGHTELPGYLSNLGASLRIRFTRTRNAADLDDAIAAGRRAAELIPPGHPDLAVILLNLGDSLRARFGHAGDTADLDAAITSWQQANELTAGTPRTRLVVAERWAAAAADAHRTRQAADGFAAAVGLLPTVAWHGLDRATREDQLARWVFLAADAAACAILDNRPELAVELLEQGRSVLWTQALNLRGDLARLAAEVPGLAESLDRVRLILDSPVPAPSPAAPGREGDSDTGPGRGRQQRDAAELRRRQAQEWDDLLSQVRALAGFEHFLAPVPYAQLRASLFATSPGGSVVIVNVSRYGCHALIIDSGAEQPRVVSLADVTLDSATDRANTMLRALAGLTDPGRAPADRGEDRLVLLGVLSWLWDAIARPVLTELGLTTDPELQERAWPRVWWCPTGPLAVLPIHAAGHHSRRPAAADPGRTECVLDRVISSYTPTLAALARARQSAPGAPARQLAVGMADTPGLLPLPSVPAELKVVAAHFPSSAGSQQLTGRLATRAAVLAAIDTRSWLHLACHASQQQADPASSGFALWDGTLTITDLAAAPSGHRDLAFLSACQTAAGSVRHLDEAIHLAAAMQFLGYRHVISTMWTIADPPAPLVARDFYAAVWHDGQHDPDRSAEALHRAVRQLRHDYPAHPVLWAPYIHLGG
jgi:tetratricopeptide (TPR) repeat protein